MHLSLTRSMARHLPRLEERLGQTLASIRQQEQQQLAAEAPCPPGPQVLALFVVARVLTADQVAGGRYMPPGEQVAAKEQLLRTSKPGMLEQGLQMMEHGAAAQYSVAAKQMLGGLLEEVWADADVAAALAVGPQEQLPGIVDVRESTQGAGTWPRADASYGWDQLDVHAAAASCCEQGKQGGGGRGREGDAVATLLALCDFQVATQQALEQVVAGVIQQQLDEPPQW